MEMEIFREFSSYFGDISSDKRSKQDRREKQKLLQEGQRRERVLLQD
ncbi:MAG: hypothetical protein ACL93V_10610 [Candidatus Electrothrix sp. YB6]